MGAVLRGGLTEDAAAAMRQELAGLKDHAVAPALLLVKGPARKAELVDVSPMLAAGAAWLIDRILPA